MLKFPARRVTPHQHIIHPFVKYIAIWVIIIVAAVSSYIPFLPKNSDDSHYRNEVALSNSKTEAVSAKKKQEKKQNSVSIVKRTNKSASIQKAPTHTPTPKKVIENKNDVQLEVPTHTPTPTLAPTKTQEPQVQSQPLSDARGQLLIALNSYRQKKGKPSLLWDENLAGFAQGRAEKFDRDGQMDSHAGFRDLIDNDGFTKMGFRSLAENSSFGDTRDPVYIIETLYGQSPGHDANQLNGEYTHVGIGASGKATNLLFGGKKI